MHPLGRHDRPLFGAGDVGGADGQPHDVVGVFDAVVVLGELSQARVFVRAIRVLAFRAFLLRVVLRHPQLLVHEAQAVIQPFVLAEVGQQANG